LVDAPRTVLKGTVLVLGILMGGAWSSARALAQEGGTPLSAERERTLRPKDSFKECETCPEMVVVPAGSFMMGSPITDSHTWVDSRQTPQRLVTLAKSFAVAKFEVTLGQFSAFIAETGYNAGSTCFTVEAGMVEERFNRSFRNPGFSQTGSHPATCLSWNDAKAYVAWLSRKTGKTYRMLTDAEWEYAARAGTTTRFYFGSGERALCGYANIADQTTLRTPFLGIEQRSAPCDDGYAYTAPVGSFRANAFGLFDMLGNVGEWTEDCVHGNLRDAPVDGSAWVTGDCRLRSLRGGSWLSLLSMSDTEMMSMASRGYRRPEERHIDTGLRVARTLTP
jgi:formylglycine-generating enzyme required for sulfatase activity